MKIGIIGSGHIGATLARLFAGVGHEVAISNSRGPDTLAPLVAEIGTGVAATWPAEAAHFGDVVVLALPWRDIDELPSADVFAGKIVIDATNPYTAEGQVMDLEERTSSGVVAGSLPGARIVKAFNTIYWETLATGGRRDKDPEDRLVIFVASDDVRAKSVVSQLIEDIGFAPVDTGSLRDGGRRQQPGTELYNRPIILKEARELLAGTC